MKIQYGSLSCVILAIAISLSTVTDAAKAKVPRTRLRGPTAKAYFKRVRQDFGRKGTRSVEYRDIVKKCSSQPEQNYGKVLYFDNTRFLLNEADKCSGKVHLLVAIHSYPPYHDRRNMIRQTWGSLNQVGDARIKLVFFVGKIESKELQAKVDEESRTYKDIVQRDFVESYRNMTRKHLTVIEWVVRFCPNADYVMKTDDDTFTDIFHAIRLLSVVKVDGFYCTATTGAKPERKSTGYLKKWRVTKEEYAGKTYPSYCEGLGYIMNTKVAKKIYWCSMFNNFFWIDDVYVAGVLPQKLGIPRTRFWNGHGHDVMKPSHAAGNVVDYIFLMAGNNEFMPTLWRRLWKTVLSNSVDL